MNEQQTEIQLLDDEYGALVIDTSVFRHYGLNLESGLLKSLQHFNRCSVALLMPDVLEGELERQLAEKAESTLSCLSSIVKNYSHLRIDKELVGSIEGALGGVQSKEIARQRIEGFVASTGASRLTASEYVNTSDIVNLYFTGSPPFESSGAKKNEFPDAIALLTVEGWAREMGRRVLGVSLDRGWHEFSRISSSVDVTNSLSEALGVFQPKLWPNILAVDVLETLDQRGSAILSEDFRDEVIRSIRDSSVQVEAHSGMSFDSYDVYVEYVTHQIPRDYNGRLMGNVISIEEDCLEIAIEINVECCVHASFDLIVWDSIDRGSICVGRTSRVSREICKTEAFITLFGKVKDGLSGVRDIAVEIRSPQLCVDFGELKLS